MTAKRARGPWTVKFNARRNWWEVHNGRRDPIAVVYTGKPDAEIMAASLRLLAALKALARAKPYTQAYVAALNTAQALAAELNGGN